MEQEHLVEDSVGRHGSASAAAADDVVDFDPSARLPGEGEHTDDEETETRGSGSQDGKLHADSARQEQQRHDGEVIQV